METNEPNKPKNEIWSIDRNQGNQWYKVRIPTNYMQDFRVIFEGVVGKSERSDIVTNFN
jgi:hypothetical protein